MTFALGSNQLKVLNAAFAGARARDVPGSTGVYAQAYNILSAIKQNHFVCECVNECTGESCA